MSERDAALFANEAFYAAINSRDAAAMDSLWLRSESVTCIHPGWDILIGTEEVLESWHRILSHDASPKIACRNAEALIHGDVAVVVCYEEIDGQLLAATNLFRRDGRSWRMIHHQAGPTAAHLPPEEEPARVPKPN